MCEEVREPAIQVPKAMVWTIVLNFVAGLGFLLPLTFVLPDITMLVSLASGQPTPVILKDALGSSTGAFLLLLPLLILGIICGVGCVTAASRCAWAFARDGGIPGSKWWKVVNPKLDIPLNAMMLGMVVEIALGAIYFGSTAAFNAFSGVGVIFLTLSYACPIAVSFFFRRRSDIANARFNLGIIGSICNVVALGKSRRSQTHKLINSLLTVYSMESSGDPSILHAYVQGRHPRDHELRLCRLLRFHGHCCALVLGLGLPQLRRSPQGGYRWGGGRFPGCACKDWVSRGRIVLYCIYCIQSCIAHCTKNPQLHTAF
jgi:hypothetical protein